MENSEKDHMTSNIKVLVYHRVVNDELLRRVHWSCVSTQQFRRHLELLDTCGFTPITFRDSLLASSGALRLPKKPVILTFENGYQSTYQHVFPLMKEFGYNGVVFALGNRTLKTDDWNSRLGLPVQQLAQDDELIEMHAAGFEIGSQSLTNADLTKLTSRAATQEIALSKEVLENIIKTNVISFSYPYGAVDQHTKGLVRNAGYHIGCGIEDGTPSFGSDPFHIRRLNMTSSTNSLSFTFRMLTSNEQSEWINPRISPVRHYPWPETGLLESIPTKVYDEAIAQYGTQ